MRAPVEGSRGDAVFTQGDRSKMAATEHGPPRENAQKGLSWPRTSDPHASSNRRRSLTIPVWACAVLGDWPRERPRTFQPEVARLLDRHLGVRRAFDRCWWACPCGRCPQTPRRSVALARAQIHCLATGPRARPPSTKPTLSRAWAASVSRGVTGGDAVFEAAPGTRSAGLPQTSRARTRLRARRHVTCVFFCAPEETEVKRAAHHSFAGRPPPPQTTVRTGTLELTNPHLPQHRARTGPQALHHREYVHPT
ncbi:hypothetical protein NDU88_008646 [Pleurodeles waltl]|uniref:Uncharacterized protein n=1 Tax=Pleurodeles waltl TaxID=8319 RepID=A0AAV7N905_PLEWA|nr:hypothetical protein NDU88_008646 [Pleurodeles waltl]